MIGEDKDPNRDSPIQPFNHSTIQRSVCFIAGETSGDQNAAGVCAAIRRFAPDVKLFGAAGSEMQAAGCEAVVDLTRLAVVGLVEVAKHYFEFRKIFYHLLDEVARRKPAAVVLTDYPGFNLRFAKALRVRGYRGKLIYFVSPQFWAWGARRARIVERCCDVVLTLFEFEKDWYARNAPKLRVEHVGHTLVDRLEALVINSRREGDLVALLPGSRESEITRLWPLMLQTVDMMLRVNSGLRFIAVAPTDMLADKLRRLRPPPKQVTIEVDGVAKTLQQASLSILASGTVSLECTFFGCPMIVVYRVAWPTYFLARTFIRVPWIAMPNILAGKQIVPELIQHKATPQVIAAVVLDWLRHPEKREQQRAELAEVVKKLGPPGANERAAKAILSEL